MINRYKPHLLIIPEDDANRQLANGFRLSRHINANVIRVLPVSGGWIKVEDDFQNNQLKDLQTFQECRIVLLVDFDNQPDRIDLIKRIIPENYQNRVFILGVFTNPEELKTSLHHNGFEKIGQGLSEDCPIKVSELWNHELLRHNQAELSRLFEDVKSFLFSDN